MNIHESRANEFEEAVWVALEGWEVLPPEWGKNVRMGDELGVFVGASGTGVSVDLTYVPTEASQECIELILERTRNAPEPDQIDVSHPPGVDWCIIQFKFEKETE
jgi:hypothetical protein